MGNLILTRKRNESVVIGGDVTLTVVEIRGDKVRLGFRAPQGVRIDRSEVRDRIEAATDGRNGSAPKGATDGV